MIGPVPSIAEQGVAWENSETSRKNQLGFPGQREIGKHIRVFLFFEYKRWRRGRELESLCIVVLKKKKNSRKYLERSHCFSDETPECLNSHEGLWSKLRRRGLSLSLLCVLRFAKL